MSEKYLVDVYVAGYMEIEVEADDQDDARAQAENDIREVCQLDHVIDTKPGFVSLKELPTRGRGDGS